MNSEIKVYKELVTIQLFDWEVKTPISIDDLELLLHSDSKFIRIWNEIIAKNQVKRVFVRKIETSENLIYSLPEEDRKKVQARLKEMEIKSWTSLSKIDLDRMKNIINHVLNNNDKNA